ncbi:uncharacterized protein [Glycine max]|uniref:uncharacterized protein isoform X3 n=1 Tax=Glycine max TaxID=3847 RepID=UPI00029647EE|nr:uncharacterized protein LOC100805773 isoform X3 [Glycine max]|eukprot:XP_014630055.1 uncharacterized protein LOC100805773 isoform X3 [Glycine max]
MPEKKNKKVSFTEEDAVTLMQRYDATTVFTLLQEVAHYPHPKIDWCELVKKSATEISNAREYQMLWRHLAYRHSLPEIFEDGDEPLPHFQDDDSDLECELEAFPPVSVECASEAAACVKVMIASRTLSESAPSSSTIEAPLTINVPVCHSSRTPIENSQPSNLMQGTSIIFPVTVQRQTLPTISSTDGIETKGIVGGNMASKRKRKAWSEEEDMQLRAAVQRWGEGNWATMAKGDDFPIKRSATQLAQRWSILRKKDGCTNTGTITSTQYTTAEQLATRHSLSLALDMPFKKLTAPGMTDVKPSTSVKNQAQIRNTTEKVSSSLVPPQQPSQQALLGSSDLHAKSKLADEKPVLKGNLISDHVVKSATATLGTRVDPLSNTISQIKVAQVKNATDTKPAVSSLTKPSISTNLPSDPKNKHVTPLADKVPLKQVVNPTKELKVSDPSTTPKEKVQENEPPKVTTGSQVDSSLEKGRFEKGLETSTPLVKISCGEEVSKDKANPVVVCEEQGSVKKATENNNIDKGSQNLDHDKKIDSINQSSNDQNANDKHVNLPVQDELSLSAKVVKSDGEC